MKNSFEKAQSAKTFIQNLFGDSFSEVNTAIILGSGLGSVTQEIKKGQFHQCSYSHVPYCVSSSVEGHAGEFLLGSLFGHKVLVLNGRVHAYEGYSPQEVVFPIKVAKALGLSNLIITNAAGAINPEFQVGDIMCINDHLNLTGTNPLFGKNEPLWGPRFLDLTKAYDKEFISIATKSASKLGINLRHGVYAGLLGPTYETPAEIKMLSTLGADAVGMSTVFETIAARHMGMKVLGLSSLTNMAAGISKSNISHEEVMENNAKGAQKFSIFLEEILQNIS